MASHFVSLNQGVEGTKYSDFTVGTTSTATDVYEFRILDGVSPKPNKVQVLKAIEAIERFFENHQQVTAAGFDIV
jgi:hypothetical protein